MRDINNLKRLWEQGYTYAQIGMLYGISRQRVHQLMNGYHNTLLETDKNAELRNAVLARDNNTCQKCGSIVNIIVHHLDNNSRHNTYHNLIALCESCHRLAHPQIYQHPNIPQAKDLPCAKCHQHPRILSSNYCRECRDIKAVFQYRKKHPTVYRKGKHEKHYTCL